MTLLRWISYLFCYLTTLGQHDFCYEHEEDRLFMRCLNCGWQTPGWGIDVSSRYIKKKEDGSRGSQT